MPALKLQKKKTYILTLFQNEESASFMNMDIIMCPSFKNNGHECHSLLCCHLVSTSNTIKATNYAPKAANIISYPVHHVANKLVVVVVQLLGPVLMAFMAYMNTLSGDFVHDDIPAIVNNPDVNGANPQVHSIFSHDFWGESMASIRSHKSYRPLTILVFRYILTCTGH